MSILMAITNMFVERLESVWHLFVSPNSRLFILYIFSAGALAAVVYTKQRPRRDWSVRPFLSYCLPLQFYRHSSFRLDFQIILFNKLIVPMSWVLQGISLVWVADTTKKILAMVWTQAPISITWGLSQQLICGSVLYLIYDLARFVCHVFHHRNPFLWRFHSIHHSAEYLNPFTTFRFHPIELLLESLTILLFVGTAAGVIQGIFGHDPIGWFEMVVVVFYFRIFGFFGATLRHTHIWLDWGPYLSHVFISPAQHQIHHSIDPKHMDKNFGICIALWDWLYGSLYVPKSEEKLHFGIQGDRPHRGLLDALLRPFADVGNKAFRSIKRSLAIEK
ncbi:MAG: sterol desaturase family protein [Myxococcales bacterium]|nr:sterol desaturase family protein [Myxococcales bacterium]